MKRMKKMLSWLAVLCLCLSMSMTALASSAADATPAVAEARQGVLQIWLYYVDSNGQEHKIQSGSGFLIGAASGATTVITNYHVVSLSNDDKKQLSEIYGVDFFNNNAITLKVKVVVKRDVEVEATYVNGSEQTDFAILELSQAIYDRSPLKLGDSSGLVETQNIYALGFPTAASVNQDDQVYTSDDVTITNGIIGKFQQVNNIDFVLHNVSLGHGNSGGPLVDSNGAVIGVNTMYTDVDNASNYYYSIAINEIAEVLDALGITYEKADGSAAVDTAEPAETTETTAVDTESTETTESEATDVTDIPTTDVTADTAETTAVVEPEGPNMLLIGGIAAAVVVLIVIIVVVIAASKKKKPAPAPYPAPTPTPGPAPAPKPMYTPNNGGGSSVTFATMPVDSGAGETSVLGAGAGETSVLGGGAMQPTATLTRRKNGESVRITKQLFTIGKERQKVDFCIPDNSSVSRTHANILCKGGIYYIVDKNSTNFTFVNGNKIAANEETKLNSGDKIKLADEEFEFRI